MNQPQSTDDTTPFGRELAASVADLLARGGTVLEGFCAHWMRQRGGRFVYELLKSERREVFGSADRAAFVDWLATQSPASLDAFVRPTCYDVIEIITPDTLASAVKTELGVADETPYGIELAERVAAALDRGVEIRYDHRDYCGMGLVKQGSDYLYCVVNDGLPDAMRAFSTRAELVAWLASQSDASLSGSDDDPFVANNQRVTRARLLEAISPPTA